MQPWDRGADPYAVEYQNWYRGGPRRASASRVRAITELGERHQPSQVHLPRDGLLPVDLLQVPVDGALRVRGRLGHVPHASAFRQARPPPDAIARRNATQQRGSPGCVSGSLSRCGVSSFYVAAPQRQHTRTVHPAAPFGCVAQPLRTCAACWMHTARCANRTGEYRQSMDCYGPWSSSGKVSTTAPVNDGICIIYSHAGSTYPTIYPTPSGRTRWRLAPGNRGIASLLPCCRPPARVSKILCLARAGNAAAGR